MSVLFHLPSDLGFRWLEGVFSSLLRSCRSVGAVRKCYNAKGFSLAAGTHLGKEELGLSFGSPSASCYTCCISWWDVLAIYFQTLVFSKLFVSDFLRCEVHKLLKRVLFPLMCACFIVGSLCRKKKEKKNIINLIKPLTLQRQFKKTSQNAFAYLKVKIVWKSRWFCFSIQRYCTACGRADIAQNV